MSTLWIFWCLALVVLPVYHFSFGNEIGRLKIRPVEGDFFVVSNLPDTRSDILGSSNLKDWKVVYNGIMPVDRSCVVRGGWKLSKYFRVIPSVYTDSQPRILYVSAKSGDDALGKPNKVKEPFASLQKALQICANGDIIFIEEGFYEVDPTMTYGVERIKPMLELKNKRDIKIIGQGEVVFKGNGPGEFLRIAGCENILIQGIEFRGDKPEVPENPVRLFTTVELSGYNQDIRFNKCRFVKFGNHGISQLHTPRASRNVYIENCHFEDGGDATVPVLFHDGAAISGIGSSWYVLNNTFVRCNRGVEVEGAFPGFPSQGILIEGNEILDSNNIGIMVFATNAPSNHYKDIVIRNNLIEHRYPNSGSGIVFDGLLGIQINGNLIKGYSIGVNIFPLKDLTNIDITDNDFIECDFGISVNRGAAQLKNMDVINNRFIRNTDFGLMAQHGDLRILKNQFINYGTWLQNSAGVVLLGSNLWKSNYVLADNKFIKDTEISNAKFDIIIDSIEGRVQLRDNKIGQSSEEPKVNIINWSDLTNQRLSELQTN